MSGPDGRHLTRSRRSAVWGLLLGGLVLAPPVSATWPEGGLVICTATGLQHSPVAVPDGSGGVFVKWTDLRTGAEGQYATRVLADGARAAGWPVNGLRLTPGMDSATVIGDGGGGLLLFGLDPLSSQVRMQSVAGDGQLRAGMSAGGLLLPLVVGGPTGKRVFACTDGAAGAFVAWNEYDFGAGSDRLRMTRVTAEGAFAPGWNAAGSIVASMTPGFDFGWAEMGFESNGTGGVLEGEIKITEDFVGSSRRGTVQSRSASGTLAMFVSLQPSGFAPPASEHETCQHVVMASDGAGGVYMEWHVVGPAAGDYLQHFLANGAPHWPSPITPPASSLKLLPAAATGVTMLGRDPTTSELELHRRAGDGSTPFGWDNGFAVAPVNTFTWADAVRSQSLHYVCWSGGPVGGATLRALAVNDAAGQADGWGGPGGIVIRSVGTAAPFGLAAGALEDAFVAFAAAGASDQDLYLQRLMPAYLGAVGGPPLAGGVLAVRGVTPDPAHSSASISLTLRAGERARLELLDVAGRVLRSESIEPGEARTSYVLSTSTLPNGLYFVRVRQTGEAAQRRFVVVH